VRQIHLRVSAELHRRLKIMAAANDQTITEMLTERVISVLAGGREPKTDRTRGNEKKPPLNGGGRR